MKFVALAVSTSVGALVACSSAVENDRKLRGEDADKSPYDCNVGCPAAVPDLVCADGITYLHECYALCQGSKSIRKGACDDESGIQFLSDSMMPESSVVYESQSSIEAAQVTASQMNQYADENFVFVGHIDLDEHIRPPSVDPTLDRKVTPSKGGDVTALRVSFDGLGYISNYIHDDSVDASDNIADKSTSTGRTNHIPNSGTGSTPTSSSRDTSTSSSKKDGKERSDKKRKKAKKTEKQKRKKEKKDKSERQSKSGKRKLGSRIFHMNAEEGSRSRKRSLVSSIQARAVIGADAGFIEESIIGDFDSRFPVSNTRASPYNKIVEIDYGSGEGGCSGVIVGRNSIITAAHCVYDRRGRKWYPVRNIAPGRFRYDGKSREPFGVWEAMDATIYGRWVHKNDASYDVAVVRLKRHPRYGSIGDRMGNIPLKYYDCDVPSGSSVTGYPADKPDGEMNTSGQCDGWRHDCGDMIVYHKCDTKGGNSGSPLLDPYGQAFGVHTHGGNEWNSGVSFTAYHLQNLRRWIR